MAKKESSHESFHLFFGSQISHHDQVRHTTNGIREIADATIPSFLDEYDREWNAARFMKIAIENSDLMRIWF